MKVKQLEVINWLLNIISVIGILEITDRLTSYLLTLKVILLTPMNSLFTLARDTPTAQLH